MRLPKACHACVEKQKADQPAGGDAVEDGSHNDIGFLRRSLADMHAHADALKNGWDASDEQRKDAMVGLERALAEVADLRAKLAEAEKKCAYIDEVNAGSELAIRDMEIWKEQCQSAEAAHHKALDRVAELEMRDVQLVESAQRANAMLLREVEAKNKALAERDSVAIDLRAELERNAEQRQKQRVEYNRALADLAAMTERAEKAEKRADHLESVENAIHAEEQARWHRAAMEAEERRDAARAEADAWKEIAKANGWVMK